MTTTKHIRQSIQTSWEALLETMDEATESIRGAGGPQAELLIAKLGTLQTALRGLGAAWQEISDILPEDALEDAETSDVAGALPESAYWKPLARCLLAAGGSARTAEAIHAVEARMADQLQPIDRALVSTGQVRWHVRVRFARERLKKHGLINNKSPRGLWQLTPAGVRWAESESTKLPDPIPPENPDQRELPF